MIMLPILKIEKANALLKKFGLIHIFHHWNGQHLENRTNFQMMIFLPNFDIEGAKNVC